MYDASQSLFEKSVSVGGKEDSERQRDVEREAERGAEKEGGGTPLSAAWTARRASTLAASRLSVPPAPPPDAVFQHIGESLSNRNI